jgi:hypothetical protein
MLRLLSRRLFRGRRYRRRRLHVAPARSAAGHRLVVLAPLADLEILAVLIGRFVARYGELAKKFRGLFGLIAIRLLTSRRGHASGHDQSPFQHLESVRSCFDIVFVGGF